MGRDFRGRVARRVDRRRLQRSTSRVNEVTLYFSLSSERWFNLGELCFEVCKISIGSFYFLQRMLIFQTSRVGDYKDTLLRVARRESAYISVPCRTFELKVEKARDAGVLEGGVLPKCSRGARSSSETTRVPRVRLR